MRENCDQVFLNVYEFLKATPGFFSPGFDLLAALAPGEQLDRAAFRDCDLLNTRHAAAFLGVKPKTLQNWRTGRNGPRYVRVGGTVSYSVGDLRAFVDCGLRTSTSDRGDLS